MEIDDSSTRHEEKSTLTSVETRIEKLNLGEKENEKAANAWAHDKDTDEYYFSSALLVIEGVTWPYFSIPRALYDSLYPHQKVGVQWMASMHSNKIGGM